MPEGGGGRSGLLFWAGDEGDECRCCFGEKFHLPPPQKQYRHNVVIARFSSKQRPIFPPPNQQLNSLTTTIPPSPR